MLQFNQRFWDKECRKASDFVNFVNINNGWHLSRLERYSKEGIIYYDAVFKVDTDFIGIDFHNARNDRKVAYRYVSREIKNKEWVDSWEIDIEPNWVYITVHTSVCRDMIRID